jgi:carboxypeptidase T
VHVKISPRQSYTLESAEGRGLPVHRSRVAEARHIDSNENGVLERSELREHVEHGHVGCGHHHEESADTNALLGELELHLLKKPNPVAAGYHSYEQVSQELDAFVAARPDLCRKVSLGTTHEGREIWALRISAGIASEQPDNRPGVVITGCHHAREWMSVEVPLHVAHKLLDNYDTDGEAQRRVQSADVWIVPVSNPDGYEHSRNEDTWWRKNRRPVETDATGQPTSAIGVDLNRNYWDGKPEHFTLYRPEGDTPGSTYDDFGATSDDPDSDTYRGPAGGSEVETQALLNLELGRKNIRGVIDHHSYGEMILYPWGHTSAPAPNKDLYVDIGGKLNAAMGNKYKLKQSSGLYPSSGESDDLHNANGLVSFTLEVGRSFQPNPSSIAPTCELVGKANLTFIDEIVRRAGDGSLPPRA